MDLKYVGAVAVGMATGASIVLALSHWKKHRSQRLENDIEFNRTTVVRENINTSTLNDSFRGLNASQVGDSLLATPARSFGPTDTMMSTQHTLLATPSREVQPEDVSSPQNGGYVHQENQSLLNLLFNIAEDKARKEGVVHRGITCNTCNCSPVCGIRYKCSNCVDYDVCDRCEPQDIHNKTHTFMKIKIPIPPLANPRNILMKPFYTGKVYNIRKLAWDELSKLKSETFFDQFEVEALYYQYLAICTKEQGITREVYDQCLGSLGIEKNLLMDRLFKFYDADGDGYINFSEFVHGLSILVKGNMEDKVEYVFEGYDLDSMGTISRDNLRKMFKAYFYITIELVRDVVKACEEEMMLNFDDNLGRPVSSMFSAPIPSSSDIAPNYNSKIPLPSNPGTREDMWPVMEAMSQDAIEEMVENVFKLAKLDHNGRINLEEFKRLACIDSSLVAWFDALGTVF
ncbi:uncharacterized protein LOC117108569 [Anneissia japonica]|uniref:uncharacterized protein LOC117108569 n=1 Tax=Anneissia japonica TaxID=1529436 RepID=UPI0014255733|nr:uncharacterized protein LOC117108569 [Anneissia japonica]XP_033106517.1 uncharacterized protein LOC117108569 [Anneissia japonica]XP_033106518.1 uncharacterized protein LOC117108569 [Anneissia japonica]XP_033106519.1 uncharacterized protein LOC117108569 [Anneissia japonica]